MGFGYQNRESELAERMRVTKAQFDRALEEKKKQQNRVDVSNRIAMALIDMINQKVIRPGPKAEERECYVMSQELRDLEPNLVDLILAIIDEAGGVK